MPTFTFNGKEVDSLPGVEQKVQLDPKIQEGLLKFFEENANNPEYQAFMAKDAKARLEVEDDLSYQVESIGEAIATHRQRTAAGADAEDVGSIDDLIAEYGDDEFVVVPRVVAGKTWYIRKHDALTLLDLETKRLDVERGQVKRNPSREVKLGMAMEFTASLYRRIAPGDGTQPPQYEAVFRDTDEAQRFFRKPSMLDLINELAEAIYDVNPTLNPLNKLRAA